MGDWLYLIIAIAAVGLLTLAGLLTSGRRRKEVPPPSGRTDVIAPPPTEGEVATEAPPEPAVDTAEPVVEAPTVEKPEGTASRLVRLRAAALPARRAASARACWPCSAASASTRTRGRRSRTPS